MKRMLPLAVLALIATVVYGVAHSQFVPPEMIPVKPEVKLGIPHPVAANSQYVIYGQDLGAVMMDTQTGDTWMLVKSKSTPTPLVWMPIQRLEGGMDVERWQKAEEEIKAGQKRKREEG